MVLTAAVPSSDGGSLSTMNEPAAICEWPARGMAIAREIDRLRWALADWAEEGKVDAPRQPCAIPAGFPLEVKQARKLARLARAFPAADRDLALPFDAYVQLMRLSAEDRAAQLAVARAERWGVKQATVVATRRRQETAAFEDNDPERLATHVYRAWNNAPAEIREHAWTLLQAAAGAGFTLVDEEEPVYG